MCTGRGGTTCLFRDLWISRNRCFVLWTEITRIIALRLSLHSLKHSLRMSRRSLRPPLELLFSSQQQVTYLLIHLDIHVSLHNFYCVHNEFCIVKLTQFWPDFDSMMISISSYEEKTFLILSSFRKSFHI